MASDSMNGNPRLALGAPTAGPALGAPTAGPALGAPTAGPALGAPTAKAVAGPYVSPGLPQAPSQAVGFRSGELVPARMVNEVLYCERLMYLEWVQGEWADNVYTVDGKAVHRRVDGKPKVLKPLPEESPPAEERPYTARSAWLTSEELGLTAKIDLVDVEGGAVVPVEYKRGKCPERPGGPYLPERAQVAAQVLLLRAHGYHCPHGEIYYAAERRRVPIDIGDGLIAETLGAVARARGLAAAGQLPAPLENSPKCRGCSLAGICLPDETRALQEEPAFIQEDAGELGADPWGLVGPSSAEEEPPVRRLYPALDDKVPLYVQDHAASVRLDGDRLIVTRKGEPATEARLNNTSSVSLYGNVQITMPALRRLMDDGIAVALHSYGGWFVGRTVGSDPKNVELRLAQYRAVTDPSFCLNQARSLVASKILNCRTLLRRNHSSNCNVALGELKQLARKARGAESLDSLLGVEGAAARAYFQSFSGMLKGDGVGTFDFERRNRRPPADPVNALLSFSYGMLAKACALAVSAAGLDPLLGFYHQPHFGRPSLALDLMEELRPVVADSVVVGVINNGVIQAGDFVTAAGSVALTASGRKRLIQAFERRMDQLVTHPIFDYRVSYRRLLEVQARLMSRLVLGELKQYPEFRIR